MDLITTVKKNWKNTLSWKYHTQILFNELVISCGKTWVKFSEWDVMWFSNELQWSVLGQVLLDGQGNDNYSFGDKFSLMNSKWVSKKAECLPTL